MCKSVEELQTIISQKFGMDSLQASEARMILANPHVFAPDEALTLLRAILSDDSIFPNSEA